VHLHTEAEIQHLCQVAQTLRIDALKMVHEAGAGHIGGSFSAAEILAALFFSHLRLDPARPDWPERDRFLLSKGHISPVYYATLARRGFFPVEELATFRKLGSRLNGHPDLDIPGVEMVAGPLGHGVAVGAGLALALRGADKPSGLTAPSSRASRGRVYVLLGDGELDAGVVWEGAMTAAKYRLGNLVAIVDCNGIQQTGATADVMPMGSLSDRWRSFGWHVLEIDGHDPRAVLAALDHADSIHASPTAILAHTTKGRGVGFMEYDHRFHGGAPTEDQYQRALAELEEGLTTWSS
jgi:transketolase